LPERSLVCVVDVQEKLLPVIAGGAAIARRIRFLLDSAALFRVAVAVTEQYPQGLGPTIPELAGHPAVTSRSEKLDFSAGALLPELPVWKQASPAPLVVLCGIETHICVLQTAIELRAAGTGVLLAVDACSSRRELDHAIALRRMRAAGVVFTTTESIAFEWCRTAGTSTFKTFSRLVREAAAD
jgi:nicotinamidase-related amidase